MQGYYDDEKLVDIVEAERIIASAQTVEDLRGALLSLCRIIKHPIALSAEDTAIILGKHRRAPD